MNDPASLPCPSPRVLSFGFKRGPIPRDYVVFDVRRIGDPDKQLDLRNLTGLDELVQVAVMRSELAPVFLASASLCLNAGLSVAFGCNQGRHRSVALAEILAEQHQLVPQHRDWSELPHRG